MEQTTPVIVNGVSEPSNGGVSEPSIGGYDTSISARMNILWRFSEEAKQTMAALAMVPKLTHDELYVNHDLKGMHPGAMFYPFDVQSADWRTGRKDQTKSFRDNFVYYDHNMVEKRVCVWAGDSCNLFEKSSGIVWVGVHVADSIRVVTSNGVVDKKRLTNVLTLLPEEVVRFLFRKSIVCEIEDLADPSSELREKIKKNIKKPFGVVSAKPGPDKESGLQASSAEYDVTRATQFLMQKMSLATNFTADETIRLAIHAFQHLFPKKLEAADIEVSVMDPKYVHTVPPKYKDATVKDLQNHVIQEHLDAFDESDPGKFEEHSAVTIDLGNPPKKLRTDPRNSLGASSNI